MNPLLPILAVIALLTGCKKEQETPEAWDSTRADYVVPFEKDGGILKCCDKRNEDPDCYVEEEGETKHLADIMNCGSEKTFWQRWVDAQRDMPTHPFYPGKM